jgi:hypothetical protein
MPPEVCQRLSAIHKARYAAGEPHPWTGRKHTDAAKAKMAAIQKQRMADPELRQQSGRRTKEQRDA